MLVRFLHSVGALSYQEALHLDVVLLVYQSVANYYFQDESQVVTRKINPKGYHWAAI